MDALITTPRLMMREFTLDDVEAVFNFSTDFEVMKYTGDWGTVKTLEDAENIIKNIWLAEYKQYGYGRYALLHREHNKVIGFCGIKYIPEHKKPDIGYRMLSEYWGEGLGFEAAEAALKYAKDTLNLDNVFAEAVVENIASNKILKKIGLKQVDRYLSYGFEVNLYQ